jgi:hypothetical protein
VVAAIPDTTNIEIEFQEMRLLQMLNSKIEGENVIPRQGPFTAAISGLVKLMNASTNLDEK